MDKATVLNRVYAANLPCRAKTVMFYLVNRANKELTCFPAISTIAKETGMSERTVQRALKELCEGGFIEKNPRYRDNGGQSSNLYVLLSIEEKISDDSVQKVDNSTKKIYKAEKRLNVDIKLCQWKKIIVINSLDTEPNVILCHRAGDIYVPP